jgi:hypothetical protein
MRLQNFKIMSMRYINPAQMMKGGRNLKSVPLRRLRYRRYKFRLPPGRQRHVTDGIFFRS